MLGFNTVCLYHKDYAPEGRTFDYTTQDINMLTKDQGWVDSPAKININLWGPQEDARVKEIAEMYDKGEIGAVDPIPASGNEAMARLQAERDFYAKELRVQREQIEQLQRDLRMSQQEYNDEMADARRAMDKPIATDAANAVRRKEAAEKVQTPKKTPPKSKPKTTKVETVGTDL